MYSICLSKNHSLPYLLQCRPTLKRNRNRFRTDERRRIGKDVWNDWKAILQISWFQHLQLQNRGYLVWSWTCTRLHKILYRLIIPKVLISWVLSITKNKLLSNSWFYSYRDEISIWISQWKTEFEYHHCEVQVHLRYQHAIEWEGSEYSLPFGWTWTLHQGRRCPLVIGLDEGFYSFL